MKYSFWGYYKKSRDEFEPRIRRKQMWAYSIFSTLISIPTWGLALLVGTSLGGVFGTWGIITLWLLCDIIPTALPLQVKRLHDVNMSAWWLLLHLLCGYGTIALLVITHLVPGTIGENQYGSDPKAIGSPESLASSESLEIEESSEID